jgi:adenosylcobalamin-dependent ribonucleoside-diphosphate reductase
VEGNYMHVIKRDGRIVKYDQDKIVKAIIKAMTAVGEVDNNLAIKIAEAVTDDFNGNKEVSVEEIQDKVEDNLIKLASSKLAKAYILYRAERAQVRDFKQAIGVEDDLKLGVNALSLLEKRYLKKIDGKKETPSQMFRRVAKAISAAEKAYGGNPDYWAKAFYNLMANKYFLPSTPVLANAGNTDDLCLFACMSGDTVVRCCAGDYMIKDLANGVLGNEFEVLTIRNGKVGVAKAFNATKTAAKELYRVELDDGSYIDLTYDHSIMLRDGSFIKVSSLIVGQSIMPFNYDINHGYQIIFEDIDKKPIATHKLVLIEHGVNVSKENAIHHKDFNKRNNSFSNLDYSMTREAHIGWHMKNAHEFNCMYNPEIAHKISVIMQGNKRALGAKRSDAFRLNMRVNNPMLNPESRYKITEAAERKRVVWTCPSCGNVLHLTPYKASIRKFCSLSCSTSGENNGNYKHGGYIKSLHNHKVVSISYLGKSDVYDLSVEGTHNFAANNIFIHNCFGFEIQDSMEDILQCAKDSGMVQKSGGGVGLHLSKLRPANDYVRSTNGVASGPISFMKIFDVISEVTKQGGIRRGGNLGLLLVSHPDIEEYIHCKSDEHTLNNFNISVAITDEFMNAVKNDSEFTLVNPKNNKPAGKIEARRLFRNIAEAAWRNGEPGVVFWDTLQKDNPTPEFGDLIVNLCSEQPLLDNEACCLGSINLEQFVEDGKIVYNSLRKVVNHAVRFLDDVLDVSYYPLDEIRTICLGNRKIGLGIMGFANMLIKMEIPYDSDEAIKIAEEIMDFINVEARKASTKLADERGDFPNITKSKIHPPQRNATLTTIAPTGSISIIAETSSGIEPLFAVVYQRTNILEGNTFFEVSTLFEEIGKREGWYKPDLVNKIIKSGGRVSGIPDVPEHWQRIFKTALEISPEWHVKMQAAFQRHTNNAISKTVNLPFKATIDDVEKVIKSAYDMNLKGITVFRSNSRSKQVLQCIECEEGSCPIEV